MSVIYIIDLLGTMVFAISGAMAAHRKRIDIFGATFTGFITAIGGGSLRDVFLNLRPVWVDDSNYLLVILLGVFISSVFNKELDRLARTLTFFDAIGIGFFCAVGVQKSLLYESSEAAAVVLGMFSAVMGGVTRDTLLNETPLIFRKEIYATACVSGALLFVILKGLHVRDDVNTFVSSSIVFIIRIISVKYKFTLPVIGRRID
ncbi:MAG TPA: trimeric intracellular cation channel family protein [Candidatus Sphingobacterium stercoripullorum]|uniref:Trimeric intracellular cation channel family protein n=1 Tax=Candidatus Sphingobacterium stercoripullorum TaxID=2838759 RepID=A0A9D1W9B0_9SPHI|nr:trimeric intracellular cation channel family protein [Candidatus Sphingobacterium stercoripullorum]HLR50173.1 trimeric intracellular cation channel family protein [Candidatus Sphingobacterium stercoripullorum]